MLDPKYIPLFLGGFVLWMAFIVAVGFFEFGGDKPLKTRTCLGCVLSCQIMKTSVGRLFADGYKEALVVGSRPPWRFRSTDLGDSVDRHGLFGRPTAAVRLTDSASWVDRH